VPHIFDVAQSQWTFPLKAGVNMNFSEILGSLKRDKKGKKRLWKPTMTPQIVGQLFGVYLPIFNFKL